MSVETSPDNPCGLRGIAFVEVCAASSELEPALTALGFSKDATHGRESIDVLTQHDVRFLLHSQPQGFTASYLDAHGPSVCSIGFEVADARQAYDTALARGARPFDHGRGRLPYDLPVVHGIGDGLIYFVERPQAWLSTEFVPHPAPVRVEPRGMRAIDHFTNNVATGQLPAAVDYYVSVFGFREIRAFDIRGRHTGLRSIALRSPDGSFCVPVNEATDERSQIAEFLREHRGPGVQHVALAVDDLLCVLDGMAGGPIRFLDTDARYYDDVFERVPSVREDPSSIAKHGVLVDGDEDGYLLQIFTRNLLGPMFFELIQRHHYASFGEGNFAGLFESIERDQEARGVL